MRFKTQGSGANFVHGGASLQEVVVPVIQFKNIRKTSKNSIKAEKVKIQPITSSNKITNTPFKIKMYLVLFLKPLLPYYNFLYFLNHSSIYL